MHYLSVIDFSLGAGKKSHMQVEEIGLFSFFLIVLFECGLKTYEKYHLSSSRKRTSLSVFYPFKIYCMKKSSTNFSYIAPPACFEPNQGSSWVRAENYLFSCLVKPVPVFPHTLLGFASRLQTIHLWHCCLGFQ